MHRIGEVFYDPTGPLGDIVVTDLPWLSAEVLSRLDGYVLELGRPTLDAVP